MFGADANWGRVLCAIGYSGAQWIRAARTWTCVLPVLSRVAGLWCAAGGQGVPFDEDLAKEVLGQDEMAIAVTFTAGRQRQGRALGLRPDVRLCEDQRRLPDLRGRARAPELSQSAGERNPNYYERIQGTRAPRGRWCEALPYIQKWYGKTIVIKYGGNAMISQELRSAVISDIVLLNLVGIHVVVVHGGGPEISDMLKKIGKESRFVDGLRYTDQETMDVVQQVLCGKVNKDLVAILNRLGGRAVGLCGLDGGPLQGQRCWARSTAWWARSPRWTPRRSVTPWTTGYIPVVSTVAQGVDSENAYNINADTAAAELAISLGAEKLILLTDVRGVLRDPKDRRSTLIHRWSTARERCPAPC